MEFFKDPFLVLRFFYYTLMTFPMIICLRLLPVLMMPLSTLIVSRYLIFGNNYELASTLESDLRDTADWGTKWLIDLWLYWFKRSNSSGAIDVKMNRSFLEEKSFKETLTLSLLLIPLSKKLEPWFALWSFFFLRILFISVNLPYGLAKNTVVMSGLVLSTAT